MYHLKLENFEFTNKEEILSNFSSYDAYNNNKIDIYKLLWKFGRNKIDLLPVVERKDGTEGFKRSDFKNITDDTLKLIEKSL